MSQKLMTVINNQYGYVFKLCLNELTLIKVLHYQAITVSNIYCGVTKTPTKKTLIFPDFTNRLNSKY